MDFVANQDLRDTSMARLVGELSRGKKTGVLEIVDAVGTSRAFFLNGMPQGARTARLTHPMGQILIDRGLLTATQLQEALDVHNRTDKLLGQVLLDMKLVTAEGLAECVAEQSRRGFIGLFGLTEGRVEFLEGLVHLTDFVPAPLPALVAIHQGVRDYAPPHALQAFLSSLTFASVKVRDGEAVQSLGAAERLALELLREPRLPGDLARRLPMPPHAIGSLLLALDALGLLEIGPALKARQ